MGLFHSFPRRFDFFGQMQFSFVQFVLFRGVVARLLFDGQCIVDQRFAFVLDAFLVVVRPPQRSGQFFVLDGEIGQKNVGRRGQIGQRRGDFGGDLLEVTVFLLLVGVGGVGLGVGVGVGHLGGVVETGAIGAIGAIVSIGRFNSINRINRVNRFKSINCFKRYVSIVSKRFQSFPIVSNRSFNQPTFSGNRFNQGSARSETEDIQDIWPRNAHPNIYINIVVFIVT